MLLKNTFEMQVMKKDNDGVSLAPLNDKIKLTACLRFGGCTLVDSQGLWNDGDKLFADDSYRMIVAFNNDDKAMKHLLDLVKLELVGGNQEAVCFTINGSTSISSSVDEARDDLAALLTMANQGRRVG